MTETLEVLDDGRARVRITPDGRLSRKEAAIYLGYKPKTLANWEIKGFGPRSVLVGGKRFYYKSALDNFIQGKAA